MPIDKLHADEVNIPLSLVRQLLEAQFPEWADLPLDVIRPEGTDNVMYKLGHDKVVRLPRMGRSAVNIEKELLWLPKLGPLLPMAIPKILGKGNPEKDYPFSWLICEWLDGKNPSAEDSLDHHQAAIDLGHFVAALQKIDPTNGPSCSRGKPLRARDGETREAIALLGDLYDTHLLTDLWESALAAPPWSGTPRWIHGDLHAGNLLAQKGRVTAVLDFGSAGVGDPASDMMVAWTLLTPETRDVFRSIVKPDASTWARGRGWALTFGTVAYPYYRTSNPLFAGIAKRAIDAVVHESG